MHGFIFLSNRSFIWLVLWASFLSRNKALSRKRFLPRNYVIKHMCLTSDLLTEPWSTLDRIVCGCVPNAVKLRHMILISIFLLPVNCPKFLCGTSQIQVFQYRLWTRGLNSCSCIMVLNFCSCILVKSLTGSVDKLSTK